MQKTHKTQKTLHRLGVFYKIAKKNEITFESIRTKICLAPQNGCLNLGFV